MTRESNFELLRIVAMLMVVFLHCNYYSLGEITPRLFHAEPCASFMRAFIEQLCVICVNVFILISGWFGIKASFKGAVSLLFQVFFYHVVITALALILWENDLSIKMVLKGFYFGSLYWFVIDYLILYAISPILNVFIKTACFRSFLLVLLVFFFLEFTLGWVIDIRFAGFNNGYSVLSFVGLYLLASFLRKFPTRLQKFSVWLNMTCYIVLSFLPVIIYYLIGKDLAFLYYSSPFVILASVFFFLAFTKLSFKSRLVNSLAVSSFSIYLVHQHPFVVKHFITLMNRAYETLGGLKYIAFVLCFTILLGLCCMIIDKLRILLWQSFLSKICDRCTKFIETKCQGIAPYENQ